VVEIKSETPLRRRASWWDDNDDENDADDSRSRRQRPKDRTGNTSVFDTFLGLDRRLQDQAAQYNQRMGLSDNNRNRDSRRRNPYDDEIDNDTAARSRDTRRKRNYSDNNDDDDLRRRNQEQRPAPVYSMDNIIDAEPVVEEEEEQTIAKDLPTDKSASDQPPPQVLLTWEERALAVERVPPANVPAWGPSGDLGIDARTKALQDCLEDLQTAQLLVEERQQQVAAAKEEIAVRRVDAELERKRMQRRQYDAIAAREQVRRTERRIQDAARQLRLRQLQYEAAVEERAATEARHWALLKTYNPETAKQVVTEAFNELEQTEPAVRRHSEKLKSNNGGGGSSGSVDHQQTQKEVEGRSEDG